MKHQYKIKRLHCAACVAKVQDALRQLPQIESASVTLNPPRADVTMREHVGVQELNRALKRAGDYSLEEIREPRTAPAPAATAAKPETSWLPLGLIFAFLTGGVVLRQLYLGHWDWDDAMGNFMGGFFLVFSFFKLLNLRGFASSYAAYDIIARRWMPYGYAYPFLELALGIACLWRFEPRATNWATLLLMGVSSIGVIQSLVNKRKIQCACLGAVFNLPMSKVTLLEDLLMAGMAAAMLLRA